MTYLTRYLSLLPILALGIWQTIYWWQHPHLTEMQVAQEFGWWTVAAVVLSFGTLLGKAALLLVRNALKEMKK